MAPPWRRREEYGTSGVALRCRQGWDIFTRRGLIIIGLEERGKYLNVLYFGILFGFNVCPLGNKKGPSIGKSL